ncbi:MAG: helix-turn-helix domain-containing protein [Beijerinckiaceae bacterium]|nr:helix-turn-helix domain-containing protein [Beijerinckiaceae bacterium]
MDSHADTTAFERRIAHHLKTLRTERGWSLDELAKSSGVSRATLSRLENGEVSPTASVLGKLCSTYGLPMSRLMALAEDGFQPLIERVRQPVWSDPAIGFRRRSVSPPSQSLVAELLECEIDPATTISYERSPKPGLEHHLFLLDGRLEVTVDDATHALKPGDCLRYLLFGASRFRTPQDCGARYCLVIL